MEPGSACCRSTTTVSEFSREVYAAKVMARLGGHSIDHPFQKGSGVVRFAPRFGKVAALTSLAAAGVLVASLAPAATAASSTAARTGPAIDLHTLKVGPANQTTSHNWGGYADTSGGGSYSKVSSSWTEPKVTCGSGTELAVFWVGIDGYTSGTVEQDGTLAECDGGQATYATWWEMYPTNSVQVVGQSVQPGDKVTSVVTRNGSSYTLTVTDKTHPANSFSTTQSCASCQNSSAEWIAERPSGSGGLFVLPDFGKIAFKNDMAVAGKKGSISKFPNDAITMVNDSQKTLVSVSGLKKGGKQFTATWKASQ
jgi:hypothetical protein